MRLTGAASRSRRKKDLDAWDNAQDDSRNKTEMEKSYGWPERNIGGKTPQASFDGAGQTEDDYRLRQYARFCYCS